MIPGLFVSRMNKDRIYRRYMMYRIIDGYCRLSWSQEEGEMKLGKGGDVGQRWGNFGPFFKLLGSELFAVPKFSESRWTQHFPTPTRCLRFVRSCLPAYLLPSDFETPSLTGESPTQSHWLRTFLHCC